MELFFKKIIFLAVCLTLFFSFFQGSTFKKNKIYSEISKTEQTQETSDSELKDIELSSNLHKESSLLSSKFLPQYYGNKNINNLFISSVPTSPPKNC